MAREKDESCLAEAIWGPITPIYMHLCDRKHPKPNNNRRLAAREQAAYVDLEREGVAKQANQLQHFTVVLKKGISGIWSYILFRRVCKFRINSCQVVTTNRQIVWCVRLGLCIPGYYVPHSTADAFQIECTARER